MLSSKLCISDRNLDFILSGEYDNKMKMEMMQEETNDKLAAALVAEKKYEEAIALYKELIRENPGKDSLILSLAWAYRDSGQLQEAIILFEQLLETELSRKVFTGFAFDELVRIYTQKGDFSRLIEICRQVVQVQPDDLSLLFTLGQSYLKSDRPAEAADVFEKLCRLEPDATLYLTSLGNACIALGDFDHAEEIYKKAAAIDPDGSDGYFFRIGHAFFESGAYNRAELYFARAIQSKGDTPLYYCSLGDACLMQDRIEEAEAAYENAIRISPEHQVSFFNRFGLALIETGHPTIAVRIFQRAVAIDPNNSFLHLHLAQACSKAGLTGGK